MGKFKQGDKRIPGAGRKKGSRNVITKTVKEAFLYAFNELQKDPKRNLVTWGKRSPNAFYMLAAKLIPVEIKAEVNATIVEVPLIQIIEPKEEPKLNP